MRIDPRLDFPGRLVDFSHLSTRSHGKTQRSTTQDLVVVVTKNNARKLRHTLEQYEGLSRDVILLDDSVSESTRRLVARVRRSIIYHGVYDQARIFRYLGPVDVSDFVSPLGTPGRTLGFCRNYAVLLAILLNRKFLLMVDDDIVIEKSRLIDESFELLRRFDIVGARTSGMPDDSIVGYIARAKGITQYDYVTGQYSGVNVDAIRYPFPNVYNEDLILYALQGPGRRFARSGYVRHLESNQFRDLGRRLQYQERGELLLRGFAEAVAQKEPQLLITAGFWRGMIKERIAEMKELEELINGEDAPQSKRAFEILSKYYPSLSPESLTSFSGQYLQSVKAWREVLTIARKKSEMMKIPLRV